MKIDLLITNAAELLPMNAPDGPLKLNSLKSIPVIENGAVAVKDGRILAAGTNETILRDFETGPETEIIDASSKTVIPGFVDCHTHLVFGGSREHEFVQKIAKSRNTNNVAMEGGIKYTVRKTRETSKDDLINLARKRLKRMLAHGITSAEIKSGYGLDLENELKMLEAINELNNLQEIDIIPTFLGAHSIPNGYTSREYTEIVINEMIPYVAKTGLAKFCDVFCEEGFFSREQSEQILRKAKEQGMLLKIHADQLANSYGASLAAELGAVSADHLDYSYDEGIKAMAAKNVIGVLTPTISFMLGTNYPDAHSMLEIGLPIALSTDFNPGAGYSESMGLVLTLACKKLKLLPSEALAAATINAAYASGVANDSGSLENGKKADILIIDAPNHNYIPYHYGVNLVETVIKNGKVVHQNKL